MLASSQPSGPTQPAGNPLSSRHREEAPAPSELPRPRRRHARGPRRDERNEAHTRKPGSLWSQTATVAHPWFCHLSAQCLCRRKSHGHRPRAGNCPLPGLRQTTTAKLEPRVWPRQAIRNHHRHPRRCKTPAARRAAGALLGEAMIDPAAGVQKKKLLRTETWFSRPCRLFGRNKGSPTFAMWLG